MAEPCGRCGYAHNEQDQERCDMCTAFLGPLKPATDEQKAYVISMATYAIPESIETDGVSLFWSQPGVTAEYETGIKHSTQAPIHSKGGDS